MLWVQILFSLLVTLSLLLTPALPEEAPHGPDRDTYDVAPRVMAPGTRTFSPWAVARGDSGRPLFPCPGEEPFRLPVGETLGSIRAETLPPGQDPA
jgi:hypothetical protein